MCVDLYNLCRKDPGKITPIIEDKLTKSKDKEKLKRQKLLMDKQRFKLIRRKSTLEMNVDYLNKLKETYYDDTLPSLTKRKSERQAQNI